MRKAFRVIGAGLALAMSVSLAACGNDGSSAEGNGTSAEYTVENSTGSQT